MLEKSRQFQNQRRNFGSKVSPLYIFGMCSYAGYGHRLKLYPNIVGATMTIQILVILFSWLALGCAVAWLIGRASDIGGTKDTPIAPVWFEDAAKSAELPEFASQSKQVRIVLSRE